MKPEVADKREAWGSKGKGGLGRQRMGNSRGGEAWCSRVEGRLGNQRRWKSGIAEERGVRGSGGEGRLG